MRVWSIPRRRARRIVGHKQPEAFAGQQQGTGAIQRLSGASGRGPHRARHGQRMSTPPVPFLEMEPASLGWTVEAPGEILRSAKNSVSRSPCSCQLCFRSKVTGGQRERRATQAPIKDLRRPWRGSPADVRGPAAARAACSGGGLAVGALPGDFGGRRGKEQAREDGESGLAGLHGADPPDTGQRAMTTRCASTRPLRPPG